MGTCRFGSRDGRKRGYSVRGGGKRIAIFCRLKGNNSTWKPDLQRRIRSIRNGHYMGDSKRTISPFLISLKGDGL